MDCGLILAIRFLPARPKSLVETYKDAIEDAVAAEDLGFKFAWTSEHHFAPDGWSPAQLPILANIAARTKTMGLGTNLFLMPFHNPLRVAEDVATVDILSNGRMDGFACGSGSIRDEFETYGLDPAERWGRMFEALQIVRRSFDEEQFDHAGKYFTFPNIRMTTRSVQKPFPLWVGGFGPKLMERAGREGYHMQGAPAGPTIDIYLNALKAAGYDPAQFNHQTFTSCHIAETADKAWEEAQEGMYHFASFYRSRDWIAMEKMQVPPLPPDASGMRNYKGPGAGMVGTVDDVLRASEAMLKGTRVTHFGVNFRPAGMSNELVRKSMKIFAKEVLPVVEKWGRPPVRAKAVSAS